MIPSEIFEQNTAILGRTGSGKSYAARGIVEDWLAAGRRVCIVDPTDVWYGLRSAASGDGPGFPVVVFGGAHADIAIGERSGERVAEIVAGRNLPAIIVTAEMTAGERHRFMTAFLATLYRLNKEPLHLVLDEADDVAPQQPLPETRRMLGDVERIVRRGRVRGFRVTMISQRSAVLNKNVLSQASVLIALRLPAKQDRDAVEGWVKGQADLDDARELLGSLSRLKRGEGWVWAPEDGVLERQMFPAIRTFDSMKTPAFGEVIAEPTKLAPVEIGELTALLASDEEDKTNTGGKTAIAEADRRGFQRGYFAGQEHERSIWRDVWQDVRDRLDGLSASLQRPGSTADVRDTAKKDLRKTPPPLAHDGPAPAAADLPKPAPELTVAATKMLPVLARGLRLTWPQIATLAGLKARGGHFNAGRKSLRDLGYVAEDGDIVSMTAAGYSAAGGSQPQPEDVVEFWRAALPQSAARVLDQLQRQDGAKWIHKVRLAEFLGLAPRGGHWNHALAILRQNRLIEMHDDQLRLAPELRSR